MSLGGRGNGGYNSRAGASRKLRHVSAYILKTACNFVLAGMLQCFCLYDAFLAVIFVHHHGFARALNPSHQNALDQSCMHEFTPRQSVQTRANAIQNGARR